MAMKQSINLLKVGALAAVMVLSGCASIVHGTSEKFTLDSAPEHAGLTVDNVFVGKTPLLVNLARKDNHTIGVRLAGFEPQTIRLHKTTSGWLWGNILFGGLIGVVVDASDGAMYNLTPAEVSAYSKAKGIHYNEDTHTLFVVLAHHVKSGWRKVGQLKKIK